ncbi:MAG: hypothetical protein M3P45_10845 [Acidobacteriota bacterium]|nr:hypothetical protein [Acidobacteriota bacterium]
MKYRILCGCLLLAFAVAMTPAQTKFSSSGKCGKADVEHSINIPDKDGHAFALGQGKCETKGKIGGANSKEGSYSEHKEVAGNLTKVWGVYVETFDSGDKVYYSYQGSVSSKNGEVVSGQNKWQMSGGTGKMRGIKGSGSCKHTPETGGYLNYACSGEYTLAGATAAKP